MKHLGWVKGFSFFAMVVSIILSGLLFAGNSPDSRGWIILRALSISAALLLLGVSLILINMEKSSESEELAKMRKESDNVTECYEKVMIELRRKEAVTILHRRLVAASEGGNWGPTTYGEAKGMNIDKLVTNLLATIAAGGLKPLVEDERQEDDNWRPSERPG